MSRLAPVTTDELATPAAGYGCLSCGGSRFELEARPAPRFTEAAGAVIRALTDRLGATVPESAPDVR